MSEPYIGEINLFAGNFAPRGWHFCDGTLINIADNNALFSILGVMYGGDGRVNFALPDLRGRIPLSFGQGTGLKNYRQGQKDGTETVTLNADQTASHTHSLMASSSSSNATDPTDKVLSDPRSGIYIDDADQNLVNMNDAAIISAGSNSVEAHENRQPYLACYYIIALEGVFPQRS